MSAALGVGYALFRLWPPRTVGAGAWPARRAHRAVPRDRRGALGRLLPAHGRAGRPVGAARERPEPRAGRGLLASLAASRDRDLALLLLRRAAGAYWGAWNPAEMAFYVGLPTLALAGIALWLAAARAPGPLLRRRRPVALLLALGDATPLHGLRPCACRSSAAFAPRRGTCCCWTSRSPCSRRTGSTALREAGATAAVGPPRPGAGAPSSRPACLSLEPLWRGRLSGDGWQRCRLGHGQLPRSWPQGLAPPALAGLDRGLALATAADEARRGGRRPAPRWWPPISRPSPRRRFGPHWVRPDTVARPDAAHALAASAGHGRVYLVSGPEPWRSASDLPLVLGLSQPRRLRLAAPRPPRRLHAGVLAVRPDRARPPRCRRRDLGRRFLATSPRSSLDARRRGVQPSASAGRPRAGGGGAEVRFRPDGRGRGSHPARDLASGGGGDSPGSRGGGGDARGDDGGPPLTLQAPRGPRTAERLHDEHVAAPPTRAPPEAWSLVDRRSEGCLLPGSLRLARDASAGLAPDRVHGAARPAPPVRRDPGRIGPGVVSSRPSWARATAASGMRPGPSSTRTSAPGRGLTPFTGSSWRARRARPSAGWRRARCGRRKRWCWRTRPRPPPPAPARPWSSIQIDEPLRVELAATMKGDGYVVLADTNYPGWRATVDGIPAPIFAANGLFRAVFVRAAPTACGSSTGLALSISEPRSRRSPRPWPWAWCWRREREPPDPEDVIRGRLVLQFTRLGPTRPNPGRPAARGASTQASLASQARGGERALADHHPPDRDGPRLAEPRYAPGPGLDPGGPAGGAFESGPPPPEPAVLLRHASGRGPAPRAGRWSGWPPAWRASASVACWSRSRRAGTRARSR